MICQDCKAVPHTGDTEVNKKDKICSLMKPITWRVRKYKGGRTKKGEMESKRERRGREGKKRGRKLFLY